MNKYEKMAVLRLIDKDPEILAHLKKSARGNKSVIMHACKKDHTAIRHASDDLRENTAFVYSTQGRNPHKLKYLLEQYPEIATSQLTNVVTIFEDPLAFADLPKEAFLDKEFIGVCKSVIGYKIDELTKGRYPLNHKQIRFANSLYNFVSETEQLRAYENGEKESQEITTQTKPVQNIVREFRNACK